MSERPILFNGEMVRAILDGSKTQTRRVVKPQPSSEHWQHIVPGYYSPTVIRDGQQEPGDEVYGFANEDEGWRCPFGGPGNILWVRETWAVHCELYDDLAPSEIHHSVAGGCWEPGDSIWYRATDERHPATGYCEPDQCGKWRPSIHMPRWASRITLQVDNVRVEQLQEITFDNVLAEGTPKEYLAGYEDNRLGFRDLWDSINAPRGFGWDANPWVWVVEYENTPPA